MTCSGRVFGCLLIAASCAGASAIAVADVVRLRSGGEVRGTVTSTVDDRIQIRSFSGSVIAVESPDVHFVARRSPVEEEYETRLAALPESAEEHWQLARWCKLNRLREVYPRQLWQVLLRDPNHAEARRALGYKLEKGVWSTRDQLMRRRGYVKVGARYITRQQRDSSAETDAERKAEAAWARRMSILADGIRAGIPAAIRELELVRDPMAVSALAAWFRDARDPAVRRLYVSALGRIRSDAVLPPLLEQAVFDPSEDVRRLALSVLPESSLDRARNGLIRYLEDDRNEIVQRAAEALGKIGDAESVEPLIESLVTLHEYSTRPSAAEEVRERAVDLLNRDDLTPQEVLLVLQTGITPPRGVPATTEESNGRVQLLYPHRNTSVLVALKRLTREEFGFDQRTWRLWLRAQNDE